MFWGAYPRKVGKRAAEQAWTSATGRAPPGTILEGAERYRDDPNREERFTAHPTTWLNADRWTDPPLPARNGQAPANGMRGPRGLLSPEAEAEARSRPGGVMTEDGW